uniref:Uncharacterized protein n=1 Tax=Haemonchus contortus TaxID=6289 RepID=A0A7I4YMC4_HAECO
MGESQSGRQIERQTEIQIDRQRYRLTDRQTGRQTDRQTDRQTERKKERKKERKTDRQTNESPAKFSVLTRKQADELPNDKTVCPTVYVCLLLLHFRLFPSTSSVSKREIA